MHRTRDHGTPSYNDARELFGLSRINEWTDLTSNKHYLVALDALYDDVDDLDAIVGGFIEDVEASNMDTQDGSGHVCFELS